MQKTIHRADSRGVAEHGWLHARHSFSFAGYHHPERMGFGKLRVLNDDIIDPAAGFGTHPHDNMEIITILLSGELHHKDSMGNAYVIKEGEVQIMSAGTGIMHSEYNHSDTNKTNLLQIWILPKELDIKPRYAQTRFEKKSLSNQFHNIVSPDKNQTDMWINQDAWLYLTELDKDHAVNLELQKKENGVYIFVIAGEIKIDDENLKQRDAIGITKAGTIAVKAVKPSRVLAIEVPTK